MQNSLLEDLRQLFRVYRGGPLSGEEDLAADVRVAVIMGAQVLKGGRPSRTLDARIRHAARLWRSGELDFLIPTGGLGDHAPKEADLMTDILLSEGVPQGGIIPEDAALNTWDSAVLVSRIAEEYGIGRARIVTDPLHCIRSVWAFEVSGLSAIPEPAYDSPMWREGWSRTGQLFREAVALVWYRLRHGKVLGRRTK